MKLIIISFETIISSEIGLVAMAVVTVGLTEKGKEALKEPGPCLSFGSNGNGRISKIL